MADNEESHPVVLHVYDLSQGLARQLSTTLLGTVIEGIWHTSVCVYGLEYYYSGGIAKAAPSQSQYGLPVKVVDLGSTQVPKDVFEEYLKEISPRYTAQTYSLLKHNCNNFSNEVAQFLVGVEIPSYILRLPQEVMASPNGALLLPMIEQMETNLRYGGVPQIPQAAANAANFQRSLRGQPPTLVVKTEQAATSKPTGESSVAPAVETAKASSNQGKPTEAVQAPTTLDDARAKVHEEITREFAALMASGGLRASEAAALAARRVMQRHGIGAGVPSTQS